MTEKLSRRKLIALVLLSATQFVVILDVSIVNVALPQIQHKLDLSTENLQWIVNAYTLVFGGCLLLGGRIADELGRRRIYLLGLVLFAGASLGCGLANSGSALIALRAVQGLGAATISPAALAILTTTFEEGRERNLALGVFGGIAGVGGAAGVLLGGILTDQLSWRWIFFINVPIALAVILIAPRYLDESRANAGKQFDVVGAFAVTLGLAALVFGLVKGGDYGWGSAKTLGALLGSVVLLSFFLMWESRQPSPLMPLKIFRNRSVAGANIVGLVISCELYSMFFFLSLYMQEVLGYSALRTGCCYLAIALPVIVAAGVAQTTVTRIGVKPVLVTGLVLSTFGLLWFARLPVNGKFVTDLLPGLLAAGVGMGLALVPVTIAAISHITNEEAGVASGLINTSQQVGGALGLAVLLAVATARTTSKMSAHVVGIPAVLSGFHAAFLVGGLITPIAIVVALVVLPGGTAEPVTPTGTPALAPEPT